MRAAQEELFYRCGEGGLVRAASVSLRDCPDHSPNLDDARAGSEWLRRVWRRPGFAEAVRQASPGFADRVEHITSGGTVEDKTIRRAAVSTLRYLLRSVGRHTPFGLFAGVTALSWGPTEARWGSDHQLSARVDNQWLGDVIDRLETDPGVLDCLDVLFNDLARQRGKRLELPQAASRVTIRYTSAVEMVRHNCGAPIRFDALARVVGDKFPDVACSTVRQLLTELVRRGFLITCLRAPLTVIDPLSYLTARLHSLGDTAMAPAAVGSPLAELDTIRAELAAHNDAGPPAERARIRGRLTTRMRGLSGAGRTPLAVDLRLDADIRLPEAVAREMEFAATALARLSTQPTGTPAWREFYTAFCDRYGTGTLVAVTDVVDPDSGLGFPPGYPGATLTAPGPSGSPERDEGLLGLAWQAVVTGAEEIVLDEDTLRRLTVAKADTVGVAPHVELAARVHAHSCEALQRGEFTLVVAPARSAGTLSSRFTPILTSPGLPELFRDVPVATVGALAVQMLCPPAYPHAQNIARVPAYLPHIVALGEHRDVRCAHNGAVIAVDDLAVLATREGLHLVSMSRRRVVEPQVFHALALEKQPPPLARFLAHLPRALTAAWHEFDWGPHTQRLPYLPRVRYRRSVLAPARWNLSETDLPTHPGGEGWHRELARWRERWRCPATVELRDADRSLRLSLDEPAHAGLLGAHLARHGHATLTETASVDELGWIGGHAHDIVVPLLTTRPPAPSPLTRHRPEVTNTTHGHIPAGVETTWLNAKIFTHPDRIDDLIAEHLPQLVESLDEQAARVWFVRFRGRHETDHLRLRLDTPTGQLFAHRAAAVGAWAEQLRRRGVASRVVFDTYYPETGRYGHGAAMAAAEAVFVADSRVVATQLRHLPAAVVDPRALTALNMIHTVAGFLGDTAEAMRWLLTRARASGTAAAPATDRVALQQAARLQRGLTPAGLSEFTGPRAAAWAERHQALTHYRHTLRPTPHPGVELDAVLEALLHMHHNRARGIDRADEAVCRRVARHTALGWTTRHGGGTG